MKSRESEEGAELNCAISSVALSRLAVAGWGESSPRRSLSSPSGSLLLLLPVFPLALILVAVTSLKEFILEIRLPVAEATIAPLDSRTLLC